jgi:Tfp pilus assembly protein PilF
MPTPGMRIGRYEILDRLGAGGMGEVFRARDHELARDVAIKFLPEDFSRSADRLARFSREARAASALDHPNIVTVHEIGSLDGRPFIVMECVQGHTLRQMVVNRPLPARRLLDVAVQLADGLAKAHAAGIVHRDLKPENVMVTCDGLVKIVDFGLARRTGASASDPDAATTAPSSAETRAETHATETVTSEGAVLGTAGYMAPEQALGRPTDHRSDQFSLGAILYEMATGRRAFRGDSKLATLMAVVERDPEPIATLNPGLPPPVRWTIERCLAKDPAGRYASTADLAHELRTVRDHLQETSGSGVLVSASRTRGERWTPWIAWPVVATAVVVLAWFGWNGIEERAVRARIPARPKIAVLPVTGDQSGLAAVGSGLLDYVVGSLDELARQHREFSVVPAADVTDADVRTPSRARDALQASLVVTIHANPDGDATRLTVGLADENGTIDSNRRFYSPASFSPDRVVDQVLELLNVQPDQRARSKLEPGAASAPGTVQRFAEGQLQLNAFRLAVRTAGTFYQEQSLTKAIGAFNDVINAQADNAAAYAYLGEAHIRLYRLTRHPKDLEAAQAVLDRARAIDKTRPAIWIALGMLYTEQRRPDADRMFEEAAALEPSSGDVRREWGLAAEQRNDHVRAEAEYREAIRLDPGSWANHSSLARLLHSLKRDDEAAAEFLTAVKMVPANPRALSNFGGFYIDRRAWDDAERVLRQAEKVQPTYGPVFSNLGTLRIRKSRDYAGAVPFFERATEISPRDWRIWYNLGLARHWGSPTHAGAADAYTKAIALLVEESTVGPPRSNIVMRLADCRAMIGQPERARALIASGLTLNPSAEDLRVSASVREFLGERAAALELLRTAVERGLSIADIESSPSLDQLRKDPRYPTVVRAARQPPPSRSTR